MFDFAHVPEVKVSEIVARYLMFSKWYRANGTIKYEAFMPPDDLEFSVTRLRDATEVEVWQVGAQAAAVSRRTLHGRADLAVQVFIGQHLSVAADPDEPSNNPNHAKVTGWPKEKSEQMMIAKEIAALPGLRRKTFPSVGANPPAIPGPVLTGQQLPPIEPPSGVRSSSLWNSFVAWIGTFFTRS